ncbi:MAG: copper resistance protein CopC/CopD [Acidimicrobiales bacterium]|nr:copper resistance protein CopC/CopD [Acidimicrobiales bacterium]
MHFVAPRLVQRCWAALLVALVMLLSTASPASAHTGFESSNPGAGQTVDQPVAEISLSFSGEATPAGEGFVVLDPSGLIREPDEVTTVDDLTWTLRFDEPLAGGVVGVRWQVAAPDAHPIDGSFSFTVSAESADVIAASEPAVGEPGVAVGSEEVSGAGAAPSGSEAIDGDSVVLDSFLDTDADTAAGASWLFGLSRTLRLVGAVGVIGGAVFAALVLRGNTREVRAVLYWVRRAGALLILGSVGAAMAQAATLQSGWSGLWSPAAWANTMWSSLGLAIALRLVGGALVMTGAKFDTRAATTAGDPVVAVKQLVSVGSGPRISGPSHSMEPPGGELYVHDGDHAWHPSASPAALVGIALIVTSFLFDGHTVSEGPRWLHAATNLIHVVTAATWAGGVAMLALVIARRNRNNVATRSLQLALRFSVVATAALVAAGIAGVVLSVVILDSPSQLWSTPWGQLLLVKVALVAIAAAGGAYNHKVIVPDLERSPDDAELAHRFRSVVTLEAVALVAVTITTALLIGASAT